MRRSTLRSGGVLALVAAALGGGAAGQALAGGNGNGPPVERDECVYTAHGSQAAEHQNAKAAHGGGGGGKTSTCSKTFARWRKSSLGIFVDASGAPASVDATTFVALGILAPGQPLRLERPVLPRDDVLLHGVRGVDAAGAQPRRRQVGLVPLRAIAEGRSGGP